MEYNYSDKDWTEDFGHENVGWRRETTDSQHEAKLPRIGWSSRFCKKRCNTQRRKNK